MKALTVRQPWASLIVAGAKDVENRTWPVPSTVTRLCLGSHDRPQRGDDFPADDPEPCTCGPAPFRIAVHAGKVATRSGWQPLCSTRPDLINLIDRAMTDRGVLLGYVTVTGCHHGDECDYIDERDGYEGPCSPWAERSVYHWTLADPVELDKPIPYKGRQGLWNLPDDVLAEVPA